MEKAKQAISDFTSRDGQHKTQVDRDTRSAVTDEHVMPTRHEETTTVLDKEIHQDHHQTLVQPIQHQETLPEQHHHNAVPVVHKAFDHSKTAGDRSPHPELEDAARYKDTSTTHETTHSSSVAPVITGEHVHHHVHQHVQPVVHKETVQPHVVHTTVPIHETHRAPTVSHGTTTLPVKTLDEFERTKGDLGKTGHGVGEFDGCAKDVVGENVPHKHGHHGKTGENMREGGMSETGALGAENRMGREGKDSGVGMRDDLAMREGNMGAGNREGIPIRERAPMLHSTDKREGLMGEAGGMGTAGTGETTGKRHGLGNDGNYKTESQRFVDPQGGKLNTASVGKTGKTTGLGTSTGAGATGNTAMDSSVPRSAGTTGTTGTTGSQGAGLSNAPSGQSASSTTSTGARKPSLKDKLNPFKDADGDGKKGIMS